MGCYGLLLVPVLENLVGSAEHGDGSVAWSRNGKQFTSVKK